MGPNLSKLLAAAKSKDYLAAPKAQHKLNLLLMTHGEALVEALRLAIDCLDPMTDPIDSRLIVSKGKELLATIEQEVGQ